MRAKQLVLTMSAIWMMAAQLEGQQQQAPLYYQTLNCIKVMPGKGREFSQFINDTSKKVGQTRARFSPGRSCEVSCRRARRLVVTI